MMNSSLMILLGAALADAVLHTLAGPDHYVPLIAIARSRGYGLARALLWTLLCGVGHVGSALVIAWLFVSVSSLLSSAEVARLDEARGALAAWSLMLLGCAYLLWSRRQRRRRVHAHRHASASLTPWVLCLIFVLGPCEALLPLLAPAALLGRASVVLVSLVFSAATVATMMVAVAAGLRGLERLHAPRWEPFSGELAGGTMFLCGAGMAFLGL
ncbi:MAG: hypothetical protein ACI4OS_06545 [Akkermansia sp.]